MPLIIPGLLVRLDKSQHNLQVLIHHHFAPAMQISTQLFTISLTCHMLQQTIEQPLRIRSIMLPKYLFDLELEVLEHLFSCPIGTDANELVLNFDARHSQQPIRIPSHWSEQKTINQ